MKNYIMQAVKYVFFLGQLKSDCIDFKGGIFDRIDGNGCAVQAI